MKIVRNVLAAITALKPQPADPSPSQMALDRLRQVRCELMVNGAEVRRIIDDERRGADGS